MELAIALTALSGAAMIGPWLVALVSSRSTPPGSGGSRRGPDDYRLAA